MHTHTKENFFHEMRSLRIYSLPFQTLRLIIPLVQPQFPHLYGEGVGKMGQGARTYFFQLKDGLPVTLCASSGRLLNPPSPALLGYSSPSATFLVPQPKPERQSPVSTHEAMGAQKGRRLAQGHTASASWSSDSSPGARGTGGCWGGPGWGCPGWGLNGFVGWRAPKRAGCWGRWEHCVPFLACFCPQLHP